MREGYIYFIWSSEQDAIKIGFATDLRFRQGALQAGNPAPLEVLYQIRGTQRLEREIHKRFKHLKIVREWFRDDEEIHTYIQALEGLMREAVTDLHRSGEHVFKSPADILEGMDEFVLPEAEVLAAGFNG